MNSEPGFTKVLLCVKISTFMTEQDHVFPDEEELLQSIEDLRELTILAKENPSKENLKKFMEKELEVMAGLEARMSEE